MLSLVVGERNHGCTLPVSRLAALRHASRTQGRDASCTEAFVAVDALCLDDFARLVIGGVVIIVGLVPEPSMSRCPG
jgi:hypothetical protein